MRSENVPVIGQVMAEQRQGHGTRVQLFEDLEKALGRPVLSFFTSFSYPVMLSNDDADMLQATLQTMDLSKGLAVIVSSPGGDGMAAERIIKICRSFSGTGEYWAIVPSKAKSAATVVCFGASKILMGPTSELGPVDPQLVETTQSGEVKVFSVFNVVASYDELFAKAVAESGHLEPYLQQLARYDNREITELRQALSLSEDISVRALSEGMLRGKSKQAIRKKIGVFLTPEKTKSHGRPIHAEEATRCGLKIEVLDKGGATWGLIYELYIRSSKFVQGKASKCVETRDQAFSTQPPQKGQR